MQSVQPRAARARASTGERTSTATGCENGIVLSDAIYVRAASLGFAPATVIDIGVGGASGVSRAFPHAHHVYIEPLPESDADLRGPAEGQDVLKLQMHAPQSWAASAPRQPQRVPDQADRAVRQATLDDLQDEHHWSSPFGLNIAAEGHEYEILKGATRLLEMTEFILCATVIPGQGDPVRGALDERFLEVVQAQGFSVGEMIEADQSRRGLHLDVLLRR